MPKKQNEQPGNEIRDPSTVPKYLRRLGINVPAVERKARKPKKVINKVAEQQKIEVATTLLANELATKKNEELKKAPEPVA